MSLTPQFYAGPVVPPIPVKITDYLGRLMLVHPREMTRFTHPDGKTVDAVRAGAVILDGDGAPLLHPHLVVTQGVLVRALGHRLQSGQRTPILARLRREENRHDPGAVVWVFKPATERDADVARAYLDEHGDPFPVAA